MSRFKFHARAPKGCFLKAVLFAIANHSHVYICQGKAREKTDTKARYSRAFKSFTLGYRAKFPATLGYSLAAAIFVEMALNAEREEALKFVLAGHNLLITGQAGVGKSRLVTSILKDCESRTLYTQYKFEYVNMAVIAITNNTAFRKHPLGALA